MKRLLAMALIAAAGALSIPQAYADLIINELMQSNIDCIKDDLNEFPDSWVELYNAGEETVKLEEYRLGDSDDHSSAYKLPVMDISPGQFILIYCDKVNDGLHTDFRLDSGKGGSVYLFHKESIVGKVEKWKKQPAPNIAFGRLSENSEELGYQAVPTPGTANCNRICKDILPEPEFSVQGKVLSDNLTLTLSVPENGPAGSIIRYTLDCTEPTETSPEYSEPLKITETTIVRAKLFCDGWLSPRSTTHSYIVHPRELTLPLVSIVSDDKYFYDNKEGILVEGDYSPDTPNYRFDWRRPVNYEYFEGINTGSVINQLCETRVKGGGSRQKKLKSMAFYANKRFGTKRFNYEFFPDQTPGIEEFKSFEMRNAGDDFNTTYMRDAIIQKSMGMNCDLDWQPSQPAIVYINGVYQGILNIRPRSNEDYVYSYYDGLEDVDVIETWNILKEGSRDNLDAFKKFYNEEGHTYEEYREWMDVEEFCNLMIMNIFYDNKDFPGNNVIMWRPTEESGKWRWIAKDTDYGMGLYGEPFDYQTLYWITTPGYDNGHNSWANSKKPTMLFRHLLETEEFKEMFINRCVVYLGDFLTAEQIKGLIQERYEELAFEFQFHHKNLYGDESKLGENVESSKEWIEQRIPSFYDQLASYFNLEKPVPLKIISGSEKETVVSFNGVTLRNREYNGQYFPKQRLNISVTEEDGDMTSAKWIVTAIQNGQTNSTTYMTTNLDIEMPTAQSVDIELLLVEDTSVEGISNDTYAGGQFEIFDIAGRRVQSANSSTSNLPSGIYILRDSKSTRKITVK